MDAGVTFTTTLAEVKVPRLMSSMDFAKLSPMDTVALSSTPKPKVEMNACHGKSPTDQVKVPDPTDSPIAKLKTLVPPTALSDLVLSKVFLLITCSLYFWEAAKPIWI